MADVGIGPLTPLILESRAARVVFSCGVDGLLVRSAGYALWYTICVPWIDPVKVT
jgi:hypothetical protein